MSSRIIVLGMTGFVGANIYETLLNNGFNVLGTSRKNDGVQKSLYLDIESEDTWDNIVEAAPNFIIDATGYGVVKTEGDLEKMYDLNYRQKKKMFKYFKHKLKNFFWIQIGTAFEYDLSYKDITEQTPCLPETHYGISKLMFSQFLLQEVKNNFLIIRPFGMLGKYESGSKIFPFLILSQLAGKEISLSSGEQKRDYISVEDLGVFIKNIIDNYLLGETELRSTLAKVINVGSGEVKSIKEYAEILATQIPNYQTQYWKWGEISTRVNEGDVFYNASNLCSILGFFPSSLADGFNKMIEFYQKKNN
jgi:nucleoside-diphosphate-sugar epimerase